MAVPDLLLRRATGLGGWVLGLGTRAGGVVRPAAKPLHPEGSVLVGILRHHGLVPPVGIAFLDQPGEHRVVVRESRAIGLPRPLPDIHGLAIRVTTPDGGHGDLLLASTGFGRLGRYVLTPSRVMYGRPMTTLLPYSTEVGPVLLGARSDSPGVIRLVCSVRGGPWRDFAELTISDTDTSDAPISFDPVLHQVPGLRQYQAVQRLREPAYRSARRSRGDG